MYCAYVTRIHNLRKHTNADRLLCGECFGNTVIVDLGTDPDQLGVYFPTDGKLGLEFAQKNDLLRRKDENGAPAGGYLDPEKRNIKALKLRGEKSDGLFLPLSCLASFTDIKKLQEGDTISVLNGITICEKYVPAVKRASGSGGGGNHVRKRSDPIFPLFQEHADTEQLAYNLSAFHAGDLVEVTLKMHGTSQRTGYLPVLQGYKYRNRMEKRLYESRKTPNVIRSKIKRAPIYDWGYVTGTRRVVLDTFIDYMRNHKVYNHWLPLFTVLLGTGCRIGEAIGLRWEDCDFDEGIISINHNMVYRKYEEDEKARFHIVTPKTSAGVRIVPMLSEVKAALQAEWETQKIVGFNESIVDGYTGFIFQNRYGDPLSPHSVNRAIDRICAAYIEDETVLADQEGRDPVLIRHFSAHNLRHTFCTRFCENERNIKVIQEIMGHADIETTMNIYAEATKEKKKESFSNLEGKIKIS